jgi:hypothetical protein
VPHPLLQVYDSRIYPDCFQLPFSNLPLFDTAIGIVVRELNSILGVPRSDFCCILADFATCACCYCTFSSEGYNSHIQGGVCSSHPDGDRGLFLFLLSLFRLCLNSSSPVKPREDYEAPRTKGRSFPNGYRPPSQTEDMLDTPVGLAYLEWNSRFGVPMDVWAVISTAVVHCAVCDLVRTHPAHSAHLDQTSGYCADVGQGEAVIGRLSR